MELPPYIVVESDGCLISIKAQPRARETSIVGMHGAKLKVRIAAPPVDSAANDALVEYLAATLGCGKRQVILIRGATSRHKVVRVVGVEVPEIIRILLGVVGVA
jgi:uncharacterized protein (TIGR00251 family)